LTIAAWKVLVLSRRREDYPKQLVKRHKDVPRLLRNIEKHLPGAKVSLRLNTNFDLALAKLRKHHEEDCWVNSDLEVCLAAATHNGFPHTLSHSAGCWVANQTKQKKKGGVESHVCRHSSAVACV
jgi:hypothetical protein